MKYASLFFLLFLFSCTSLIKKATKSGRKFSFNSKSDYYNYLIIKKEFSPNQIIFPDSSSYISFGQTVLMEEDIVIYLGSFLNDSVSLKKSPLLKDNQACIGRMNKEIAKNLSLTDYPDSIINTGINLSRYNFYYLEDHKKFTLSNTSNRLKIFLLYYYPFGIGYDKLYKEIQEACLKYKDKTELYIICIDPVYYLK